MQVYYYEQNDSIYEATAKDYSPRGSGRNSSNSTSRC
jgi:hypothetical protein